jgi:hypothetical protein
MADQSPRQANRMAEGAPPVVENLTLPLMGEEEGQMMMPQGRMPAEGGENVMFAGGDEGMQAQLPGGELPPQQAATTRAAPSETYIRLRVRVDQGHMTVVDSREVEGPLAEPTMLHGSYAYEVTLGPRRIHAESIPDLGVSRSFPNPQGPPEQQGHHITEHASYEFNVRIPRTELSAATLSEAEIVLYRVKEPGQTPPLAVGSLSANLDRELREVARLRGIPSEVLSKTSMP